MANKLGNASLLLPDLLTFSHVNTIYLYLLSEGHLCDIKAVLIQILLVEVQDLLMVHIVGSLV